MPFLNHEQPSYLPIAMALLMAAGVGMASAATTSTVPAASAVEDAKPPKPAAFLQAQIGGMVKIIPDGQPKPAMQQFLEELIALDDRTKAPGHWIDELPVLHPAKTKTDLGRLSSQDIYSNLAIVNAHWPTFQKRNPKTAAQLAQLLGRPQVRALPKYAIGSKLSKRPPAGKRSVQQDFEAFVEDWRDKTEKVKKGSDKDYFQAIGEIVLYVDFLDAHGDIAAKENALELLKSMGLMLDLYLLKHAKDKSLTADIGMELALPLMDNQPGQFSSYWVGILLAALKDTGRVPELHAVRQWAINQEQCKNNFKELMLIDRASAYGALKDGMGVFINLHAAFAHRKMDRQTQQVLIFALQRKFGPKQGQVFALRYMSLIQPVSPLPSKSKP